MNVLALEYPGRVPEFAYVEDGIGARRGAHPYHSPTAESGAGNFIG